MTSKLTLLKNALADVTERSFSKLKYLDDVHDFPTICLYRNPNEFDHIETNSINKNNIITIRGYVKGEDSLGLADQLIEDIETRLSNALVSPSTEYGFCGLLTQSGDNLVENLLVIPNYLQTQSLDIITTQSGDLIETSVTALQGRYLVANCVIGLTSASTEDVRVMSVNSDEGLFDPYGVIDMVVEIREVT
jgi:hypothetical protein